MRWRNFNTIFSFKQYNFDFFPCIHGAVVVFIYITKIIILSIICRKIKLIFSNDVFQTELPQLLIL